MVNDAPHRQRFVLYNVAILNFAFPLLQDQIVLFSNYILRSKTSVSSAKEAASILISLGKIAASPHLTLAKADVTSGSSISEENSKIAVSLFASRVVVRTHYSSRLIC